MPCSEPAAGNAAGRPAADGRQFSLFAARGKAFFAGGNGGAGGQKHRSAKITAGALLRTVL